MKLSDPTFHPWHPNGFKDIAVLMSGGVDSSVAALILKEQGVERGGRDDEDPVCWRL